MDDILKIKDLTFKYTDTLIFKSLNLTLKYNDWYTLIGNSGSGKTTLVKIICGLIEGSFNIEFNFLDLKEKNKAEIRTKISVLFSDIDTNFIENNVYDELTFELRNMRYSQVEIDEFLKDVDEITNVSKLFAKEFSKLSNYEKCLVLLASSLMIKPKLLIIDETFDCLSKKEREQLYNMILEYKNKYKLTVLNITNNSEDSLIGDNIVVLENKNILYNDGIKKVYNEHLLDEKKYKHPFIIELSEHLKLYEIIDKNYYSMEELVDEIWK